VFEKYQKFLSGKHEVRFVVSIDLDDETMGDAVVDRILAYGNVAVHRGNSKTKIEAVNADLDKIGTDFDILMLASDDMIPQLRNYDDRIATDMAENFPDLDGVLAYKDGRRDDDLITFAIVGKKYFDRFGYLYNPIYKSVYADNEFTDVAKKLEKVKYFDLVPFVHGWADYVGWDDLMKRNEDRSTYIRDQGVFNFRKSQGFPR
jgi:hypothetical protein